MTTIAIASLASLVIVASVKSADVLATVALWLAVIAFLVQIASFLGQFLISAQQATESKVVFAETKALLGRLEARAEATHVVIGNQYDKLLDRVIARASATVEAVASSGEEINADDLKARLATDLTDIVEAERESATVTLGVSAAPSSPRRDPTAVFRQWPSQSQLEQLAQDRLGELSSHGRAALRDLAATYLTNLHAGRAPAPIALSPSDPGVRELVDREVLQRIGDDEDSARARRYRLTSKGRTALRLFTAHGPPPTSAVELLPWLSETAGSIDASP